MFTVTAYPLGRRESLTWDDGTWTGAPAAVALAEDFETDAIVVSIPGVYDGPAARRPDLAALATALVVFAGQDPRVSGDPPIGELPDGAIA